MGDRWHSVFVEDDPRDLRVRDMYFQRFGGFHFNAPVRELVPRVIRLCATHPEVVPLVARWLARTLQRVGGVKVLLRHRVVPTTFVMHRFMHADDVAPAWALLERGEMSDDPRILETQERLQACSYAMAHPETGRVVPACVQHSILDPEENRQLATALPISLRRRSAEPSLPD